MSNNSFEMNKLWKSIALSFFKGFVLILLLFELLLSISNWEWNGSWRQRSIRENTAVEMHAEDIWRNGRSTLKKFDPLSCSITTHKELLHKWQEVSCTEDDQSGQTWIYTARYSLYSHYLTWLIPLLKKPQPAREMQKLEVKKPQQGHQ